MNKHHDPITQQQEKKNKEKKGWTIVIIPSSLIWAVTSEYLTDKPWYNILDIYIFKCMFYPTALKILV